MPAEQRFKALDGLRAYAALQVVIYHYYCMPARPETWFKYWERVVISWDGMNLFFTLSGYLIGGILLSAKGREGMIKVFYARRFFRLIPLYALLLASYWVVRLVDNHFRLGLIYAWYSNVPFWTYVTFTQNIWIVKYGSVGGAWLMVTWSLAVEQQFYLFAPWLVRWLRTAGLALVAIAAIAISAIRLQNPTSEWLLFDRMDTLGSGLLLAILASVPRCRAWLQRHQRPLRWLVGSYLIALMAQHVAGGFVSIFTIRPVTALMYALMIHLLAEDVPWPGLKPLLNWLAPLGALSYFMYLFHFPILYVLEEFVPVGRWLAVLVTLGCAAVSYRYFERPLIEYGHRFRYGERKPAPAQR